MATPFDVMFSGVPSELLVALNKEIAGSDIDLTGLIAHKTTHQTGGSDALAVANATATNAEATAVNQNTTATNQATTATNQNATATNQAATATNQAATATNQAATATNVDWTASLHVHYEGPIAAEVVTVAAAQPIADGALTLAANPDFPRKLNVAITDGDSSVTAGTLTISGKAVDGAAQTEDVELTGGTATKTTSKAFSTVTSAVIASVAGAGGGDTVSIGVAASLGLPCPRNATSLSVYKSCVDNADEAVGTVDATAKTIAPTTAADGSNTYDFWYNVDVPVTQNSHNHTQDSHNHTQDSHNHTQDAHTHTQDNHTHTQDAHLHTQNSHNHTQAAHTHTLA